MKTFAQFLDDNIVELQQEVIDDVVSHSEEALVDFFSTFVSAGRAADAAKIITSGNTIEVTLAPPLNYLLTGTGLYGPYQQEFIVASPTKVLSWESGGTRYFASAVKNPGMRSQFSESELLRAITDSYSVGDDE